MATDETYDDAVDDDNDDHDDEDADVDDDDAADDDFFVSACSVAPSTTPVTLHPSATAR